MPEIQGGKERESETYFSYGEGLSDEDNEVDWVFLRQGYSMWRSLEIDATFPATSG